MENKPIPMTASERVLKANRALLARGGRRVPAGYLQPDVAKVLDDLVSAGYAASPLSCIVTALHDAHKKIKRQ